MRKYLAVLLGVIFILSLAVTAFAQDKPEITLGGKILVRGWYFDNVSAYLPKKTDSQAFYTTNANIIIDAKVGDNVRGMMELETATYGNVNSGLYVWGTYDSKPKADLFFRQLWIQYTGSGLLGVPTGIKAGHMLLALGEKQFLRNERFGNDAILLWVDPTKEMHLAIGTTKLNEGVKENHTDDLDGYLLIATYKLDKDNTVGLNYLLARSDGNLPSLGTGVNIDSLNFQNLGAHANGKVAGLSYGAEVDFQFGKAKNVLGVEDAKFRGYGIFAKLGYMLDPVNLRASFALGSGDNSGDAKIKEFQTLMGPDEVAPVARLVNYTQIYERTVRTAAAEAVVSTTLGGNIRNTGIANTTYYNLGLDVNPMKELSVSLDGFILRATKTGLWGDDVSKDVGWEIDTKISYKIAKNLTYFIEAGTFKPGKFYEESGLVSDKKTVNQAVHGLSLTF